LSGRPRCLAEPAWYSARHGNVPDQDTIEALAEEWLDVMLPGTEHAVSPRRVAAFRRT
jgi:hypothetical protein